MKRFIKVFGLILLYMALWSGLILVVILSLREADDITVVKVAFAFLAAIFVFFIPYLNFAIRLIYFFPAPATGPAGRTENIGSLQQPLDFESLRKALLSVNDRDIPVQAVESRNGKKISLSYRIADARWAEIMAEAGLRSSYECLLKFNKKKRTVTLIDIRRSLTFRGGTGGFRLGWSFSRGVDNAFEIQKTRSIQDAFTKPAVDYTFSTHEIKGPVIQTIHDHGWHVRFAMW